MTIKTPFSKDNKEELDKYRQDCIDLGYGAINVSPAGVDHTPLISLYDRQENLMRSCSLTPQQSQEAYAKIMESGISIEQKAFLPGTYQFEQTEEQKLSTARGALDQLSDEQRFELMGEYCQTCGTKHNPICYCGPEYDL